MIFLSKIWFQADPGSLDKLKKDLDKVVNRQDKVYIDAVVRSEEAKMKIKDLDNAIKEAIKSGNKQILMKLVIDKAQAESGLKDIQQALKETDNRIWWVKNSMANIGSFIKNAFWITAIVEFTKRVFTLTSQMEQLKAWFTTLTGSETEAVRLLGEIDAFAKATPFNKLQIAENAQKLMAFWFNSKQVIPTMQALGNAVSAVWWKDIWEKMNRVVLAIWQIQTKGKLSAQEMNQLAENGIWWWDLLAKSMGKSTQELMKMWENGQLLAKDVIPALLWQMQKQYGWLMQEMAKTLSWRLSNVQDTLESTLARFGTNMTDFFSAGINGAFDFVDNILPIFLELFVQIKNWWAEIWGFVGSVMEMITWVSADETDKQAGHHVTLWEKIRTLWDFVWSGLIAIIQWVFGTILDYLFSFYDSIANRTFSITDIMKWAFVWASQAIMNSVIWIMNYVISKIEAVVNTGISWINSLISLANKVPGVNIGNVWKVWFQLDYYWNGKWIFDKIGDGLKWTKDWVVWFFAEMGKNTAKAFDTNLQKTSSYLGNWWSAKYKEKSVSDIMSALWGLWWAGWSGSSGSWKAAKETEEFKKKVDALKDSYKILDNELKKVQTTREKQIDAEKKWSQTLQKSQEDTQNSLKKTREEYQKTIDKLNEENRKQSTDSIGGYYQSLLDAKQAEEKAQTESIGTSTIFDPAKLESIKKQIIEIQALKNSDGSLSLDQNTRAKIDQRSSLTDQEKERFDFMEKYAQIQIDLANKTSEATDKFSQSRSQIEGMQQVIEFFKWTDLRGAKLDNTAQGLKKKFNNDETSNLIDKLLTEKKNLISITDDRISAESRVHTEAMRLSTVYHNAEVEMVRARKAEYDELIAKITQAIQAAEALRAAQASVWVSTTSGGKWFAEGGYTGDGGKYDVAWVVHKWEYVIPQNVLANIRSNLPSFVPSLEAMRTGNSANTSNIDQSRHISITGPIRVEREVDFERLLSRAAWRNR